jgi:hypothetical protein
MSEMVLADKGRTLLDILPLSPLLFFLSLDPRL